jgi:hypothetical protein
LRKAIGGYLGLTKAAGGPPNFFAGPGPWLLGESLQVLQSGRCYAARLA